MESIKAYLQEVKKIPLLKVTEERQLTNAVKTGDMQARQKMVRSNLRLVINIAKKYMNMGIPLIDLIEEGNIGLIKAVDKFKPRKGFRFSTYAAWWIKQAISRSLSDKAKLIRLPVYMNDLVLRYKRVANKLTQKYHRKPTVSEIAITMKLPVEKVKKIIHWQSRTISLDAPIGDDDQNQVIDLVKDTTISPEDDVEHLFDKERVDKLLGIMNKREREILDLRFGLSDGKTYTLADIAKRLNLSRERIRQIEEHALLKLKKFITVQTEDF